jgi:hypothetical protein
MRALGPPTAPGGASPPTVVVTPTRARRTAATAAGWCLPPLRPLLRLFITGGWRARRGVGAPASGGPRPHWHTSRARSLPRRLLRTLAEMGHGDELVLADANFPAHSVAAGTPAGVIYADGNTMPEVLKAVLSLLPLDETAPPCAVMGMVSGVAGTRWQAAGDPCVVLAWAAHAHDAPCARTSQANASPVAFGAGAGARRGGLEDAHLGHVQDAGQRGRGARRPV